MRLNRFLLLCLIFLLIPSRWVGAAAPVTVRIAMSPIANLDPVSLPRYDANVRDLAENLFVGLTRYDAASRQIQPMLARDWTVSSDGLTWTFNLRNDMKWVAYNATTGQVEALRPVVADDYVYAIRRACDPQPPNPAAHSVYIIVGCLRVATASPALVNDLFIARELAVRALNDYKLEIKIAFPAPYFVTLLALPEFRPVPREAIAKDPDWTKFGTIVTNGPWVMTEWTRDQQMTLIRNPLWPDSFHGNVEQVVVSFVSTPADAAQQFSAGSVDYARLDTPSALKLKQANSDAVLLTPGQSVVVLGYSVERPVTSSEAFRRALSQSVNRETLVNQVWPGAAMPASRFTPPDTLGSPDDPPDNSGFNPDSAQAALIASGFAKCKLPEKLTLLVEDRPEMVTLAQALVQQWQAAFGCRPDAITVRAVPLNYVEAVSHAAISASDKTNPPRAQLWLASWRPDYADANAWLGDGLHCQFGFLRPGLACNDGDKMIDAAALESDPAKRADLYRQVEALWFGPKGSFPVAPLAVTYDAVARQTRLMGVAATATGSAWFAAWTIS